MPHAFAKVGKKRSTRREKHDAYETPYETTEALLRHVRFDGRILEPAAGTGKIARVLRRHGYAVDTADVQRGRDFLKRRAACDNVVTNPPYHDDMPERFVRHALSLVGPRGQVAMLLKPGFLWSTGRSAWLAANPPKLLIVVANRIKFTHPNGRPIKGQFFDHWWLVWDKAAWASQRVIFEEERR